MMRGSTVAASVSVTNNLPSNLTGRENDFVSLLGGA
jgi:hypothetical protein